MKVALVLYMEMTVHSGMVENKYDGTCVGGLLMTKLITVFVEQSWKLVVRILGSGMKLAYRP